MATAHAKRINIVSLKLVKESSITYGKRKINSPSDAHELVREYLQDEDREHFMVVCMDTKNQPTAIHTVSIGSLNTSLVHPREVFKVAILSNANAILLAHNHPTGDSTPSREDVEVTNRLVDVGNIIGIDVVDHIIVGDKYTSLRERGLL